MSKYPISWCSCTNWNWFVLKLYKIKIIKDTNKFKIDALNAIYLTVSDVSWLSLFKTNVKIPIIGIKSKDDNNIKKIKDIILK